MDKVQKTERLIVKLKKTASVAIEKHNYNKALAALSACAHVLYEYNQRYKDDEIENMLLDVGASLISLPNDYSPKDIHPVRTVLFYDGFGLDLRGLAANMTKNIASLGYKLIYVTNELCKNRQPVIRDTLKDYNVVFEYIDMNKDYVEWAKKLCQIFLDYAPQVAYFYSLPYDVSGAMVFNCYKDRVVRFLQNLTDHAFWVGLNAFDYCGASRAMSTWINIHERGIPLEKMYRNRSNIFINEKIIREELPFDVNKYRYVFSGGALYKTLGDPDNKYYKTIEHIITNHANLVFLYAGEGDDSEFQLLMKKYPDKVFLIHERNDFYQIIQGSVFYLNTYPMFGGQMMRYAAYAGKLPITLKHNDDGEGILFNQKELEIEFDDYEDLIEEIDRVLTDDDYRKEKESRLSRAVVTKEEAQNNIKQLIETQVSPLPVLVDEFDTSKFRQEYIERLNYNKLKRDCIAKKINKELFLMFPFTFLKQFCYTRMRRVKK